MARQTGGEASGNGKVQRVGMWQRGRSDLDPLSVAVFLRSSSSSKDDDPAVTASDAAADVKFRAS